MITLIALAAHVVVGMSDYCVDHAADGSVTTECAVPTLTRKQERWLYSKVLYLVSYHPALASTDYATMLQHRYYAVQNGVFEFGLPPGYSVR